MLALSISFAEGNKIQSISDYVMLYHSILIALCLLRNIGCQAYLKIKTRHHSLPKLERFFSYIHNCSYLWTREWFTSKSATGQWKLLL